MKAVNSGDVADLQANPHFMMLLNDATVKEIVRKVKKGAKLLLYNHIAVDIAFRSGYYHRKIQKGYKYGYNL